MSTPDRPNRSESTTILPKTFSDLPTKEGWIKKGTNAFFNKWPTRYIVLENQCLYCFSSNVQSKFLGGINFNKISISITSFPNRKELHIVPLSASGIVKLRFSDYKECQEWFEALNQHIMSSRGKRKALVDYPLWTLNRISVEEFKSIAETGDIILFKSKNIAGSMQRVFCQSEYDHVAIVYKYPSGDLAFLESTKESGVDLCYWDDFLAYAWGQSYSKMVFRKLILDNPEPLNDKLDDFIRTSLGKKFGIGAKKLLSRFTKWKTEEETFFCSELVARAYQELGILSSTKPASSYWPGDFSEKSKIPLKSSRLLLEQMIDFRIIQSVLMK